MCQPVLREGGSCFVEPDWEPGGPPDHIGLTGCQQGSCPGAALTCFLPPRVVMPLHQGTFVSPSAGKVDASCRLEAPAGLKPEIPLSQGDTVASPDICTQTILLV